MVLLIVRQIGLTHGKEVSKVMARLFPMTIKGKAFWTTKRHLNLKSTKKRIETSSISNVWGMDTFLHNVPTSEQWWLESMETLK